jgi:hypothetical protein
MDAGKRKSLEESINRLWQACGCAEASIATVVFVVLWFLGLHPFEAWRQQASALQSGLACLAYVSVGVAAAKICAIVLAHRHLARLLEREGDAIFGGENKRLATSTSQPLQGPAH